MSPYSSTQSSSGVLQPGSSTGAAPGNGTPAWFYVVLAACCLVLTAAVTYASVSIGRAAAAAVVRSGADSASERRWTSIARGSRVLDTQTGAICDVVQQTCEAPPVTGSGDPHLTGP